MMASFGESPTKEDCQLVQKYSIKRLEAAINNFIKVLRIDLERLHRHKLNIQKFQQLGEWSALNHEQINASRTVQQIQATIRGLQRTRAQVEHSDIEIFDSRIKVIQQEAISGVQEFITMHGDVADEPFPQENRIESTAEAAATPDTNSKDLTFEDTDSQQLQEQVQSIANREAEESYVHLKEKLLQLNSVVNQFSDCVHVSPPATGGYQRRLMPPTGNMPNCSACSKVPHVSIFSLADLSASELILWFFIGRRPASTIDFFSKSISQIHFKLGGKVPWSQQEKVDNVEDNIYKAQESVQQGTMNLAMGSKLKAAIFPVAGALVGGVVAGPVGLLAGAKLGAAAAVGGGLLGFAGGSLWKKRQTKIVETEMQNITPKRTRSLPDLKSLDKQ